MKIRYASNPLKELGLVVVGLLVVAFLATTNHISWDVPDGVVDSVYPVVNERSMSVVSSFDVGWWPPAVIAVASEQGGKLIYTQRAFEPLDLGVVSVGADDVKHTGLTPRLVFGLEPVYLGTSATDDASVAQFGRLHNRLSAAQAKTVPVPAPVPSSGVGLDGQSPEDHSNKVDVLGTSAAFLLAECGGLEGPFCAAVASANPSLFSVPCLFRPHNRQFAVSRVHNQSLLVGCQLPSSPLSFKDVLVESFT
jgi:hypothetical protein